MNVNLLYRDYDWNGPSFYKDYLNIIRDLSLNSLFTVASKEIVYEGKNVKKVSEPDMYIKDVFQSVMMTPLKNFDEIKYRQDIIKDFLAIDGLADNLYSLSANMLDEWIKVGRHTTGKPGGDTASKLVTRIHELMLFNDYLGKLTDIFSKHTDKIKSQGLIEFYKRLCCEYNPERVTELKAVLAQVSFYVKSETKKAMVNKPSISVECGIGENGKLDDFVLINAKSKAVKYRDPTGPIATIHNYFAKFSPDTVYCLQDQHTAEQAAGIEYSVVKKIIDECEPFYKDFCDMWDRLHFQIAFYKGAVLLARQIERFDIDYCFPVETGKRNLDFEELKEFVMCIGQNVDPVGNTLNIDNRNLIIITGANQGGKSTFLRSIGIAQVMMQCGLMVTAKSYASGIFSELFMHFTRREDSEMNSGRLDEELNRMNQIIESLDDNSMILLNESFATTTEKDGSRIAYDIIKALNESGVRIITVTHLLSFARKYYDEGHEDTEFLCAERMTDGKRTYKMISSVPELTSFGLDLYDHIIKK